METVEIGATITREATAADATRVRVIPCCERLIDRTSLQVSACWATSYDLFHCPVLVSVFGWGELFVGSFGLAEEGLALLGGVGIGDLGVSVCWG